MRVPQSRLLLASALLPIALSGCEHLKLLRPSVLKQLDTDVAALVNEFPEVDHPNEAIVARLFAHGGLTRAELGADGIMRDHITVPPNEFIWKPAEMLAFAKECGPNVGLLLDSWHWHHAGGTVKDILDAGRQRRHRLERQSHRAGSCGRSRALRRRSRTMVPRAQRRARSRSTAALDPTLSTAARATGSS